MTFVNNVATWFGDRRNWSGTDGIPIRLLEHLQYSIMALLVAAVIALPLALWIGHTGRFAFLIVNLSNAMRALPTVGVLILVVALVGIGQTSVLVALVVLAIPPILVNTYAGVRSVERTIPAAAKGMGMKGWQVLVHAELPSALPAILLGFRVAAVQTVSTATIAAYVSLGGLGRFVYDGFQTQVYGMVAGGAVLIGLLALATEAFFTLLVPLLVSPGVTRRPVRSFGRTRQIAVRGTP
jgi:osmoprotectant transport system permease protein